MFGGSGSRLWGSPVDQWFPLKAAETKREVVCVCVRGWNMNATIIALSCFMWVCVDNITYKARSAEGAMLYAELI